MNRLRIKLGAVMIEAELLSNATAETVCGALPFEAQGVFVNDEIVISAPVYAPLEDGARHQVMPGQIAYRTSDQTLIIGREPPTHRLRSELCMAGMANVFAHATTSLENLRELPGRFRVRIEAIR
jgi:hypothetical protein